MCLRLSYHTFSLSNISVCLCDVANATTVCYSNNPFSKTQNSVFTARCNTRWCCCRKSNGQQETIAVMRRCCNLLMNSQFVLLLLWKDKALGHQNGDLGGHIIWSNLPPTYSFWRTLPSENWKDNVKIFVQDVNTAT